MKTRQSGVLLDYSISSSFSESDNDSDSQASSKASNISSTSEGSPRTSATGVKRSAVATKPSSESEKPSSAATTKPSSTAKMSGNQEANHEAEKRRKPNPSGSFFEEKKDMNETKNYVPNFQRKSNEYNLSKSILLKNDGLVSLEDVLSGAVKISQFHIMQFHIVDIRNLKQVTMGEKNKKSSKPTSCERLVKLYCPRSKGPYNVAALIVTSGVQSKDDRSFWGIANEARDNGKLAPGQLVLLSSIDQVSKWMNNGQLPVIETKRPMMPLLNNLKSKPTPLIKLAGVTSAAVLLVEVETEQVYFVNAGCSCCLCNGMSLFDNGMLRQDICACYGKRITANRQILVMDLTLVEKKTGMTRKIKEVCNRDFQDTFITEGANAQNQHCDILNANQGFMYDVAKATKAVFEKGNKDGWLCCVHFKVGEIVDGVESNQNPTYGQTQEKVQSTNLVLHLSRFELAEPTAHPEAEWKKLKVNIQDCLKKNDVNQSSDEEETEENE